MLLSAEHISKNYGMKQLLDDVSLFLDDKERIGIVGLNGTGKSTLLKILAGIEPSDSGNVIANTGAKVAFLSQNPIMNDAFTVMEQVLEGFSAEFCELNSYEAKAMLNRLGITDFDANIGALSGGQRKRVALASVLIHPADVLILDEPTNHLDSEMVGWLEQYLSRFGGGLIMVTHDRYFLERVVNHITELSASKLFTYEANYSKYLEIKAARMEMNSASERKRQSILRTEQQWIMRGARARSTKSRDRIERYEALKEQSPAAADASVQMAVSSSRLGSKIIELGAVSKCFDGRTVINNFSYMFSRDDRIGIVGKNGAGKSTLLNIVAGQLIPDSGFVDVGETVKIGYFMQECGELDPQMRVYDFVCQVANEIKTREGTFSAAQMLERFLFGSDLQYTLIGRLSGGEKRRLYLLSILMSAPNILLLDEPTNDLDIETLTILEDYLTSFPGAVIAVSHDRYFLDKISSNIFEVSESGEVTNYNGNFSDYFAKRRETEPAIAKIKMTAPSRRDDDSQLTKKLKFSFKEQREFESIDNDISAMETEIALCGAEIAQVSSDYVLLQSLMEQKKLSECKLEQLTERWLYLNELSEKIQEQSK